ncbi:hypothetical protein C6W92_13035 [Roseovarius sp. A46]|uniref:hypothetical protein n=1 Tax=Roseovarius sp. A46 TaxID=2109331 RepID=UPI00101285CC|nr:hypothetical protein [Roseovarius sp. A46]RXV60802.1 hypothetical protein C6W92_13035 [Roseovarius sp. A46]
MSTWISEPGARRALACAALLLALPGCLGPVADNPQRPVKEIVLGAGAVRVSAPRGYCIDDGSLRSLAGGGGFALLAPCAQLAGTPGQTAAPALMTVSVMRQARDAAPPDAEGLVAAIAPAPVGAQGQEAGLAYVQVMQGGEAVLPGGDPRHWRGARSVGGHLASLSLYAPEGSALAGREGRLLLADLAAGLSGRAPEAPAEADTDTEVEAETTTGAETGAEATAAKTQRRGFFARLFPVSD